MSSNNNDTNQGKNKSEVLDSVDRITNLRPQKPAQKPQEKPKK